MLDMMLSGEVKSERNKNHEEPDILTEHEKEKDSWVLVCHGLCFIAERYPMHLR